MHIQDDVAQIFYNALRINCNMHNTLRMYISSGANLWWKKEPNEIGFSNQVIAFAFAFCFFFSLPLSTSI